MTLDGFHSRRHCSNKFAEEDTQPLAPALAGRTPVAAVRRGQNRPGHMARCSWREHSRRAGSWLLRLAQRAGLRGGWTLVRYRAQGLKSILPAPIRARWPRTEEKPSWELEGRRPPHDAQFEAEAERLRQERILTWRERADERARRRSRTSVPPPLAPRP